MNEFPRTVVGGVSVSRMIVGSNWMAGWSHTGAAADAMINRVHYTSDMAAHMLTEALSEGVDTFMAPFAGQPKLLDAVKRAEDAVGRRIILVDTPIINVDDNPAARAEAKATIEKSRELGATFCLIHHTSAEQLVNKNKRTIDRLDDYTAMIRDAGLIPGLSAHMPELIVYSDANGYDVETYIQIYNCMGFLMQVEIESVARIINSAKKPVMTIKPMAAGRTTPFVGLNFSWNTIRPCDMVTVGCINADEICEDIEISRAALEHRMPNLSVRSSPARAQAVLK